MSKTFAALLLSSTFVTSALAASPADILAANKAAMGNWNGKATLKVEYAYSGQGLTGTTIVARGSADRRLCRHLQHRSGERRVRL